MSEVAEVVVGIASNIGREKNITAALDALAQVFGDLVISPVYESSAYSESNQYLTEGSSSESNFQNTIPQYYNLVVSFQTDRSVVELKQWLKGIEEQQGRKRHAHVVTLDMDLLLCDDRVEEIESVVIPHKDIDSRAYVLRPLSDILPEKKHPVIKKTYAYLWQEFSPKPRLTPVDFIWHEQLLSVSAPLPVM